MIDMPVPDVRSTRITGQVIRVDRYGNLVTNIDRKSFERLAQSGTIQIQVGTHVVGRLVATYADIGQGEVCALFGSSDHLEVAENAASAVERLALDRGARVVVRRD